VFLTTFYGVGDAAVPIYISLFAVSNVFGPVLLGHLFDTVGSQADDHGHLHRLGDRARSPDGPVRGRDARQVGPGRVSSSPGMAASSALGDSPYEREVDVIERTLDEHGPVERRELARLVGARFWGPGRFATALRRAVESGRAQRLSRSRCGPSIGPG
jgi:hypothetical protein